MRVAVLGAGLQGVCVALELAHRGVEVLLVDQDSVPINRASLRNEGKIHLGLVYANDPTLATAHSMLQGALQFRNLLNRWTYNRFDEVAHSTAFWYLVARNSLLSVSQLCDYYNALQNIYEEYLLQDSNLNYLGTRPERLVWKLSEESFRSHYPSPMIQAGFGTSELAIDAKGLALLLREVLAENPRIRFLNKRRVKEVYRYHSAFRVEGTKPEGKWRFSCDQVVNALWGGRLSIDRNMNLLPSRSWVYRLKYRVMVHLPPELCLHPSATYVLGPYGDVVVLPKGIGYVSWYPVCLRGWSKEVSPPNSWDAICRGELAPEEIAGMADKILEVSDAWCPGLIRSKPFAVDAGVIFAWGSTDIHDPRSELHTRSKAGVTSEDGYHSIDTGKLTTAPVFAMKAAGKVLNQELDAVYG